MNDSTSELTRRLKAEAARLGFDRVGIAPAVVPPGYAYFVDWLGRDFAAGMAYLSKHAEAHSHPDHVMEGVRSVILVSMVYGQRRSDVPDSRSGKVARYARGADYHKVLWGRLETLLHWLERESLGVKGRAVADTAPLLERDFARLAGVGWIGKNTMLIDRRLGSYTVLGALLVDCPLDYDEPEEHGYCGTCTRCLDACPTSAFTGPYQLDARRCISYWTIEHRGPIPEEIAANLDGWAFGCDICQEVCPWNRKAPDGLDPALASRPEWSNPDLLGWLTADPVEFRRLLKGTALERAKRSGLMRNAALVLGGLRETSAIPALVDCLHDSDPGVREAAAWALGQIGGEEAVAALRVALNATSDCERLTIERAIAQCGELPQEIATNRTDETREEASSRVSSSPG